MTHHRTQSLILFFTLFLALALATPVLAQEATPTVPPSQPKQPASGPGSEDTAFPAARMQHYGEEPQGFWLWEPVEDPDAATPVAAGPFPAILYLSGCCAAGDYPTPDEVDAWMSHLARQGYVVIAPIYRSDTVLEDVPLILQEALDELAKPGHPAIDLEQFAVVAYSFGGVPALHYASTADGAGLPVPKALFAIAPCVGGGFCQVIPADPVYPEGMKAVVMALERDVAVGKQAPIDVYAAFASLPVENRDFITVLADDTGTPPIDPHHWALIDDVDALDWYAPWKVSGALLSCAFTGEFCEYALGNTSEQRFMGEWSDGTPVAELQIADDAPQATPEASPAAKDLSTIGHAVIGVWEIDVDALCPGCVISYATFSPDGTYVEGGEASVAIGTWKPTGERTIELAFLVQYIDPAQEQDLLNWDLSQTPHGTGFVTPHLEYWRATLTLDEDGKTMTSVGYFQGYDDNGDPGFNSGEMVMTWTRMITDPDASSSTPTT